MRIICFKEQNENGIENLISFQLNRMKPIIWTYIQRVKGVQKWYEKTNQKEEDKGEDGELVLKDEGDEQG